jgi:hypothetical protein
MPKKKTPDTAGSRPSAARRVKTPMVPTEEEIANRAYQLFVERGGEHGRDREDWLIAERELR